MARERYTIKTTTFHGISLRILFAFVVVIIIFGIPYFLMPVFPLPKDPVIELCIEEYGWDIMRLGRDVSFSPMTTDWHEIVSSIRFVELYIYYDMPKLYHTVTYGYCFVAGGADFYYFGQHLRGGG